MGAAIRCASTLLAAPSAELRLLLLSDGKPHDMDPYEGRYGIEDTRVSLVEARQLGQFPFRVAFDRKAASYLPYLFGAGGFMVLRSPAELPDKLPQVYAELLRQR